MAPRLSGQSSIFGVVFFVSKSLLGIERQKNLKKLAILTRKPRTCLVGVNGVLLSRGSVELSRKVRNSFKESVFRIVQYKRTDTTRKWHLPFSGVARVMIQWFTSCQLYFVKCISSERLSRYKSTSRMGREAMAY